MTPFLALAWRCLTSRLGLGIIGIAAIAAALMLAGNLGKAHGTIRGLKRDIVTQEEGWAKCRADLASSQAREVQLRGTVDELDTANKRLIADSDQIKRNMEAKVAEARRQVANYRRQAEGIRTARVEGERCQWAQDFHVRVLTEERQ